MDRRNIQKFLTDHPVAAVGSALGFAISSYGLASSAYEIWTAGFRPWVWQVAGLTIFFLSVARLLLVFWTRLEAAIGKLEANATSQPSTGPVQAQVRAAQDTLATALSDLDGLTEKTYELETRLAELTARLARDESRLADVCKESGWIAKLIAEAAEDELRVGEADQLIQRFEQALSENSSSLGDFQDVTTTADALGRSVGLRVHDHQDCMVSDVTQAIAESEKTGSGDAQRRGHLTYWLRYARSIRMRLTRSLASRLLELRAYESQRP